MAIRAAGRRAGTRGFAVVAWGANFNGQCGVRESLPLLARPLEVSDLSSLPITDVYASSDHSAAIDAQGSVYTWGCGEGGRLGLCAFGEDARRPERVEALVGRTAAVSAALAPRCTLVVGAEGSLWAMGEGWPARAASLGLEAASGRALAASLRTREDLWEPQGGEESGAQRAGEAQPEAEGSGSGSISGGAVEAAQSEAARSAATSSSSSSSSSSSFSSSGSEPRGGSSRFRASSERDDSEGAARSSGAPASPSPSSSLSSPSAPHAASRNASDRRGSASGSSFAASARVASASASGSASAPDLTEALAAELDTLLVPLNAAGPSAIAASGVPVRSVDPRLAKVEAAAAASGLATLLTAAGEVRTIGPGLWGEPRFDADVTGRQTHEALVQLHTATPRGKGDGGGEGGEGDADGQAGAAGQDRASGRGGRGGSRAGGGAGGGSRAAAGPGAPMAAPMASVPAVLAPPAILAPPASLVAPAFSAPPVSSAPPASLEPSPSLFSFARPPPSLPTSAPNSLLLTPSVSSSLLLPPSAPSSLPSPTAAPAPLLSSSLWSSSPAFLSSSSSSSSSLATPRRSASAPPLATRLLEESGGAVLPLAVQGVAGALSAEGRLVLWFPLSSEPGDDLCEATWGGRAGGAARAETPGASFPRLTTGLGPIRGVSAWLDGRFAVATFDALPPLLTAAGGGGRVLASDGVDVWSLGPGRSARDDRERCGYSREHWLRPVRVHRGSALGAGIRALASGDASAAAFVTDDADLFLWGRLLHPSFLAHAKQADPQAAAWTGHGADRPTRVQGLGKVAGIALGGHHAIALVA